MEYHSIILNSVSKPLLIGSSANSDQKEEQHHYNITILSVSPNAATWHQFNGQGLLTEKSSGKH